MPLMVNKGLVLREWLRNEWSEDLDTSGKTSQTNLPKWRSIKQGKMRGGCKPGLSPYKSTGKF